MPKRKLPPTEEPSEPQEVSQPRPSKRLRFANVAYNPPSRDILTTISSELLLRILSFLSSSELLNISPTSQRLYRLASDPHLWREHYYERFVLPRALRIPGFRLGGAEGTKLQYSSRRAVWADGRKGRAPQDEVLRESNKTESVDWKRQYKLRHNWARGKCAVEEVSVRDAPDENGGQKRTLVKVVEGIAITADSESGLRAWDLRTRRPIAQLNLHEENESDDNAPTSLAVDENGSGTVVDIVVGFADGGFGLWRLNLERQELLRRYRHEKSCNGELVAVACGYPYVLTATTAGLISLYTFNRPDDKSSDDAANSVKDEPSSKATATATEKPPSAILPPPYLLTSLKSHTTHLPLALSIRRMSSSVSASIAYTFSAREGWCIGIQDLLITPSADGSGVDTISSRLASTLPIAASGGADSTQTNESRSGLTTLCYSHPYLLATLPDNTLVLYLCTSTATFLSLSLGIRLWGHTSGISDAEITPLGKAVSISTRGDEIRVWELEGRGGGSSIEVRPTSRQPADDASIPTSAPRAEWEDRRNWVGFDDEMVIVLKEARDGRESLMVYDFT